MSEIIDFGKIEMMAAEIDGRIRSLTTFTDHMRTIAQSLDHFRQSKEDKYMMELRQVKSDVAYIKEQLERLGLPQIDLYERKFGFITNKLRGDEWPAALDPSYIETSDEQETIRANNILDLIVTEFLKDLKFLDFGCGKGHVAHEAAKRGTKLSVGYDIAAGWQFESTPQTVFVNQLDGVKDHAPYDVVLLYDVLDHLRGNPIEILGHVREMLSSRGRVYVRTHPWTSRHGAHLHKQINKAFLHLILDDVELVRVGGYVSEHTLKMTDPLAAYRNWFFNAGYNIKNETIITQPVEPFFTTVENMPIKEKLVNLWQGEDPVKHMQIQFVDYMLEPKESKHQIF